LEKYYGIAAKMMPWCRLDW